MLRVGLTGDLGSGKSTVARMLADRGAVVFSSDDMARAMMQPGHAVYAAIVDSFGPSVLGEDKSLDRRKLAALAFDTAHPRIEELNAIVHPAVLEAQAAQITDLAQTNPDGIAVVESALIFSTRHAAMGPAAGRPGPEGAWPSRFDRILLVTAPGPEKIARFVKRIAAGRDLSADERLAIEADARQRLALQHTVNHANGCIVLHNDRDLGYLEQQVDAAWNELRRI